MKVLATGSRHVRVSLSLRAVTGQLAIRPVKSERAAAIGDWTTGLRGAGD